jgi:hypothetical protein
MHLFIPYAGTKHFHVLWWRWDEMQLLPERSYLFFEESECTNVGVEMWYECRDL